MVINSQDTKGEFEGKLQERFEQLPKVVQSAISSAEVEKHLRELATTHKLHVDQWQSLENEVMLALFGFQPIEDLQANIKKEVGVSDEVAAALAADISTVVFEPIRQELERGLEHPEAKTASVSDVEAARIQVLGQAPTANESIAIKLPEPARPSVAPGTPPQPPPETKVERGPASGAYKPGEMSIARKVVEDDPYREPPA